MKSVTKQDPISALHELLKWSGSRPEWQRDALRRIVVNGTLDEKDISDLGDLCRSKRKAPGINNPSVKAEPLNSSHIPPGPGLQASVTLVSVGNFQGVNRLPSLGFMITKSGASKKSTTYSSVIPSKEQGRPGQQQRDWKHFLSK
jgi:hypothetical protein